MELVHEYSVAAFKYAMNDFVYQNKICQKMFLSFFYKTLTATIGGFTNHYLQNASYAVSCDKKCDG